jgi:hypothetical protein
VSPVEKRFYGVGAAVCALLLLTAATWLAAQGETARAVAAGGFGAGLALGGLAAVGLGGREGSRLRQDPARPGNRTFWRLLLGAAFIAIFDDALAGVPIFVATGFMIGLIGTILTTTARRRT